MSRIFRISNFQMLEWSWAFEIVLKITLFDYGMVFILLNSETSTSSKKTTGYLYWLETWIVCL